MSHIGVALMDVHLTGVALLSWDMALMGVALTSVPLTGMSLMGVSLIGVSLMSVPLKRAYHRQLISIVNTGTAVERAKGHMRYVDRRNL
jgi:hypothetical protein